MLPGNDPIHMSNQKSKTTTKPTTKMVQGVPFTEGHKKILEHIKRHRLWIQVELTQFECGKYDVNSLMLNL